MREIIFIGHANPEDDEFTMWLYSKLKNEGYKVECDLTCLTGGESDYWKTLQDILDNKAIKYLLVFSQNTFEKQGIIDEWGQARGIEQKNRIQDFTMVLKMDNVPFDARIGLNVKNQFRFDVSWAEALKKLIFKLNKDNVPKDSITNLSVNDWLKNKYATNSNISSKEEKFYSNLLEIPTLPDKIFFYRYLYDTQAEAIYKEVERFTIIKHDNYLITFLDDLPKYSKIENLEVLYSEKFEVETNFALNKFNSDKFPQYPDLKRFLIRLLKEAIHRFFQQRGLQFYVMSQKSKCFYYKRIEGMGKKIHFRYENKPISKQLFGIYFNSFWHYGISVHALLYPYLCYSLKAHIVFTDDGLNVWNQTHKLHSARRSKGKTFYNEQWRNLMLAFVNSLSDDGFSIIIPLSDQFKLRLPTSTIQFYSDFGFDEPQDNGRIVPIDFYDDDEDLDDIDVAIETNNEK